MASNLFIALGGAGCKVISGLQKMNHILYSHDVQTVGQAQTDPNYYVYIDADDRVKVFSQNREANTTTMPFSSFRTEAFYKTEQQKGEVNAWFDSENIVLPDLNLYNGAGGERQIGRKGYWNGCNIAMEELLNKIKNNNRHSIISGTNIFEDTTIYIVTGSVGGTGSGIFIDVLYTIWRYYIQQGYNGNMNIKAIILMPGSFLNMVNDPNLRLKYKMNGYAFLNEVNAFIKFGLTNLEDQFHSFVPGIYNTPASPNQNWQPLNAAVIIDDSNDKFAFKQEFLYNTITEFLYTYTFGRDKLGTSNKPINIETRTIESLLDSALTNSEPNRNLPQVDFFNSFGLLVVQSATAEHFPAFVTSRFKLDILEYLTENSDGFKNGANNEKVLYKTLQKALSEVYRAFENSYISSFQTPKLEKSAMVDYARLLKGLDFSKPITIANGAELDIIVAAINRLNTTLNYICDECNSKILSFIQEQLFEGVSLNSLQILLRKLDEDYYHLFLNEQNFNLQDKKDDQIIKDAVAIIKSRAKMHFYHKLSKGSDTGNASGCIDISLNYLASISKELHALINHITINDYDPIIESLVELQGNGLKRIVPDVDDLISTYHNKWIIKPDGALVKWYDELQVDLKAHSKTLFISVFKDDRYNDYLKPQSLDLKKFSKSFQLHLNELTDRLRSEDVTYKSRMDKSLLQISEEEKCEKAFVHYKNFDFPFIKLKKSAVPSKTVYAGYNFENNSELFKQIGYDPNSFNDILLDSLQFKHRLVKLVFFSKISFDDYFLYEDMKQNFEVSFTKKRKAGESVPCPFIHKAFEGENFEGDVYGILYSKARPIDTFE